MREGNKRVMERVKKELVRMRQQCETILVKYDVEEPAPGSMPARPVYLIGQYEQYLPGNTA
ncbi:hypothetical protein D0C36_19780 [Mucilaginibacter conchicola]|uniref:Uncharacterized protein n=1 Tax=Mucilaginibacter conchicola TaxID=2303333 RepID=A0A372NQH2_9SPHI|nr:hypothetical protein D0C36_19780 [Mucilaginibacter conchicola]